MCGVRGRIFHELEVVFNALVLCLKGTETLMYSCRTRHYLMHVVRNVCVYDGMFVR